MPLPKTLTLTIRPRRWLILAALVLVAWLAWGELTRPRGAQKVAFTPAAQECATSGPLTYCIYRAAGGTNGDIVYHLHGRNLDAQLWNDDTYYTALVQAEWQRTGSPPPTVVSLSYGSTWLLAPKGAAPASGLLEDLIARLPQIEAGLPPPRRRLLLGESMGGLNSLVAGLTYPQQFAKVAALCPVVYATSPFASFATMRAAARRTGADPKTGFGVWWLARDYVANEAEWQRFSPLALIERADAASPALYLSGGLYDHFGNFEGTEMLARAAQARGVETEWHPLYGGHCAIDASSLAAFLVK